MSNEAVKVNATKAAKRNKRKQNKYDEASLQEEVIELLRSEGFVVIPPSHKQPVSESPTEKTLHLESKTDHAADLGPCDSSAKTKTKKNKLNENVAKNVQLSKKKMKQKLKINASKNEENKSNSKKDYQRKVQKKVRAENSISEDTRRKVALSKRDDTATKYTFPKCVRKREMLQLLADQDPENPTYVKGCVRINPHNVNQAYLGIDNGPDILISGVRDRNRAMDRDVVAVTINPEDDWFLQENGEMQKTGTVVCILEKIHPRKIVGTLVPQKDRLRLLSRDQRVPALVINPKSVPKDVLSSPKAHAKTLFLARIDEWVAPYSCKGSIESIIGNVGDLEGETKAILLANELDVEPYEEELLEGLPGSEYVPTAEEIEGREDWREECVFTIDPATAVDLDDAVSCKKLDNGNFEVGVHISDVTHYLKASSPLDEKVSQRATTVYLVNTVYHMLPKALCNVCSLLPGRDKLAFSVVWEMTPEARVVKHRFAKTIVKSCYQMSYEVAQAIIDDSSSIELPGLVTTDHTPDRICEVVNDLYALSTQIRERRFAEGALTINQPKLQIILDQETRIPISYRIEERQESNRLIEEFMLLANMTVAEHLYETMPDTAFLRNHGEPLERVLSRTVGDLGHLGVHLKVDSAASLQASLSVYEKTSQDEQAEKFATSCLMMVINCLCSQSMARATYICSGQYDEKADLRHFALNVPLYTHFTSPIRRYADCVVHRLLHASMTNEPMPDEWSADLCAKIAATCNDKKYSAKIAQEKSNELYFMDLLARKGPTDTMAVVMKVKQQSMYVILCYVGITIRMLYSDFEKKAECEYNKEHCVSTVVVKWKDSDLVQTINVFSIINLRIEKHPKKYSIRAILLPTRLDDSASCT